MITDERCLPNYYLIVVLKSKLNIKWFENNLQQTWFEDVFFVSTILVAKINVARRFEFHFVAGCSRYTLNCIFVPLQIFGKYYQSPVKIFDPLFLLYLWWQMYFILIATITLLKCSTGSILNFCICPSKRSIPEILEF